MFLNLVTAVLMVVLLNSAFALIDLETVRSRPIPWAAIGLTVIALAGIVVQHSWHGAIAALDDDPSQSGWWRVITSVFMQNGGVIGTPFNIITLAAVVALAEWFWGAPLTLGLFLGGAILPQHLDSLLGTTGDNTDPRNFVGSSGATYFLAATLAAALLLSTRIGKERLLASSVPALGLATWFAQENGHGLVATEGFVLGVAVWIGFRLVRKLTRDTEPTAAGTHSRHDGGHGRNPGAGSVGPLVAQGPIRRN